MTQTHLRPRLELSLETGLQPAHILDRKRALDHVHENQHTTLKAFKATEVSPLCNASNQTRFVCPAHTSSVTKTDGENDLVPSDSHPTRTLRYPSSPTAFRLSGRTLQMVRWCLLLQTRKNGRKAREFVLLSGRTNALKHSKKKLVGRNRVAMRFLSTHGIRYYQQISSASNLCWPGLVGKARCNVHVHGQPKVYQQGN